MSVRGQSRHAPSSKTADALPIYPKSRHRCRRPTVAAMGQQLPHALQQKLDFRQHFISAMIEFAGTDRLPRRETSSCLAANCKQEKARGAEVYRVPRSYLGCWGGIPLKAWERPGVPPGHRGMDCARGLRGHRAGNHFRRRPQGPTRNQYGVQ